MKRGLVAKLMSPAAVALTAVLAWLPAAQAGSSFSISIYGGDGYRHGHYYDRYHGPYGGYRHEHRYRRHIYVFPGHGLRYGHERPYWKYRHGYHEPRHYRWHGPHCIYRYGYRYCR